MKVIGYGDYMIRLSPFEYDRFFQTDTVRMTYTGAEANACMALGFWGEKVAFVTRLPRHTVSRKAVSCLDACRVDTSHIAYGGPRMGLFFIEKGAAVRPSAVIYDRLPSSFTEGSVTDYDWDAIIETGDWFFTTGITPSLTPKSAETCLAVLQEVKKRGGFTAYDVNYRATLIDEAGAGAILRKAAPFIDCLIVNEEQAKKLLGISSDYGEEETAERLRDITDKIRAELSIEKIAVTARRTFSSTDTAVFASYDDGKDFAVSRRYDLHLVDRVGSGDAFSAGLLRSIIHGNSAEDAVQWAVAANAMNHTINGDVTYADVAEIDAVRQDKTRDVRR